MLQDRHANEDRDPFLFEAMITLAIPFVILVIELAVSNAPG